MSLSSGAPVQKLLGDSQTAVPHLHTIKQNKLMQVVPRASCRCPRQVARLLQSSPSDANAMNWYRWLGHAAAIIPSDPPVQPRFRHPMEGRTLHWWPKKTFQSSDVKNKGGSISGLDARWVCLKIGHRMVYDIYHYYTSKWLFQMRKTTPNHQIWGIHGGYHRHP